MKLLRYILWSCLAGFAVALLLNASSELRAQKSTAGEVLPAKEVILFSSNAVQDVSVKKASGKMKWKSESVADAQQALTTTCEFPTRFDDFNLISRITYVGGDAGYASAVTDTIYIDPDGVSKDGTSYKEKFTSINSRSGCGGHHGGGSKPKSYGKFSGKIRDGKMQVIYSIGKVKEKMGIQEPENYDSVHDTMQDSKPIKGSDQIRTTITIYPLSGSPEAHAVMSDVQYNARKTGGTVKVK